MIAYPDIPQITMYPAPSDESTPRIAITDAPLPAPQQAREVDHAWANLRIINPALHDGPIFLFDFPISGHVGIKHPLASLRAHRSTYKHLATAATLNKPLRALGVQGLVLGRDLAGEQHLLLGRRSSQTRIYPGLWENAPSGTVTPPLGTESSIHAPHFLRALLDEGIEELGLDLASARSTFVGLLDDAEARSLDIVLRLELPALIDPRRTPCSTNDAARWEYAATAWVPMARLSVWAGEHAHAISPPTLALIRWLNEPRTT